PRQMTVVNCKNNVVMIRPVPREALLVGGRADAICATIDRYENWISAMWGGAVDIHRQWYAFGPGELYSPRYPKLSGPDSKKQILEDNRTGPHPASLRLPDAVQEVITKDSAHFAVELSTRSGKLNERNQREDSGRESKNDGDPSSDTSAIGHSEEGSKRSQQQKRNSQERAKKREVDDESGVPRNGDYTHQKEYGCEDNGNTSQ